MENTKQIDWRYRLHEIIFEADTKAGKAFDVILIFSIIASVIVVMLDSIASYQARYGDWFYKIEWFFTILFTIEYILRIVSVKRAWGYIFSFYGIVDLLSILPTYMSVLLPGSQYFW